MAQPKASKKSPKRLKGETISVGPKSNGINASNKGIEKMQKPKNVKTDVIRKIEETRSELTRRFTVRRIGVFGSFARGNEGQESDVDILVELTEPTFDNYMDLKFFLEKILNRPVDLVMADTVKPRLKPIIEQEVIYA